ncbi:MAG: DUF4162 domain-containing protein, partial [Chitinophagaceae bacterium]
TVKEARQKYKAGLFRLGFDGEAPAVEHSSFSIVKKEANSVVVKMNEGSHSNQVLSAYLQQGTLISSFNEILPSLSDIFIELVEGTPASRQFQNVTA